MSPTSDEIRLELGRVLASEAFANTSRLSRFLAFVVDKTLAGESDRLKEFVIGVEVFDRDADYDPRIDSIVRVEAGRLRTKIEEYYRREGRDDPVVIRVDKGSYAPAFERRAADARVSEHGGSGRRPLPAHIGLAAGIAFAIIAALTIAVAAWRTDSRTEAGAQTITIAVLPFAPYSSETADRILATRLTEGVTAELVRAGSFGVVASTSALEFADARGSLSDVARALDADILMEARILVDGERLRVEARLVDGALNHKYWVEIFDGDVKNLDELERRIATAAAAAVPSERAR
jgi:TolB-like protein